MFKARGVPVLGIEPARNVAEVAIRDGVPTLTEFFSAACARRVAEENGRADLIVANNVIAHVPDPHDFVEGISMLLAPGGVVTIEFPHLLHLVRDCQFDTIYHEHFSYFSLMTVERLLCSHGLRMADVEELPTHGGSLRVYARPGGREADGEDVRVQAVRKEEAAAGLDKLSAYACFAERTEQTKRELLDVLSRIKSESMSIAGYGAPAKGNTLLNYGGIGPEVVDYTVDRNPYKQGRYLPGSRILIRDPEQIAVTRPDYVLVLPWNLREEISAQLAYIGEWGGAFIIPMPRPKVVRCAS